VKVLVLDEGYAGHVDGLDVVLGGPLAGDDVAALLIDVHISVREEDFDRLPALRAIATASTGFDHVDVATASRRGVWVCNVPDYCTTEVAETTMGFLLALVRGIVVQDRNVRGGGWDPRAVPSMRRLRDVRVGIVGFGRIGSAVAERALLLGCEVWANDPFVSAETIAAAGVRPAALDELLRECDAVSLHVPLAEDTIGLIGARELGLMRPAAVLLNTARGQVVDLEALLGALRSGRLAGAALDVLSEEPPTSPLEAPGLIVTPHAAWYSPAAEAERYARAAASVRAVLAGRTPEGAVNAPN
jgi:D-3-phosphoglycerate dehydrogenase